jgi:hypothetical protein
MEMLRILGVSRLATKVRGDGLTAEAEEEEAAEGGGSRVTEV